MTSINDAVAQALEQERAQVRALLDRLAAATWKQHLTGTAANAAIGEAWRDLLAHFSDELSTPNLLAQFESQGLVSKRAPHWQSSHCIVNPATRVCAYHGGTVR